jgi:hypothetical protein
LAALVLAITLPVAARAQNPAEAPGDIQVRALGSTGSTIYIAVTRDGIPVPPDEFWAIIRERITQLFLDVPAALAPTLDVGFSPAPDGGWTISLARGGTPAADAQVRIAVDTEEPAIATGDSYHLPALSDGVHEIDVRLYTADGRAYLSDGAFVGRRVALLESVGSAGLTNPTLFDVPLVGGKPIGPDTLNIRQGTVTEIRLSSSDYDVGLHLHGYDIEAEVWPSFPVSLLFKADIPGRFPIESHGGAGEATILYLEVHP